MRKKVRVQQPENAVETNKAVTADVKTQETVKVDSNKAKLKSKKQLQDNQKLSKKIRINSDKDSAPTSNRRSRYLRNNGQRNNKNREETSSNQTEAVESRYPEVNEQVKDDTEVES